MKYKLSVIIPVYNAQNTIRRCMESILLGNETNLQVILIDDCSTDNCPQICRELAAAFPQIVYLRNPANRGVSYSRNAGLCAAKGEFIFFVDSDDWVSKDYIAHLVLAAQTHPGQLIACGYHFIDKTTGTRAVIPASLPENIHSGNSVDPYWLAEKIMLQALWNKIFRRDIIEAAHIRFDETQSMGEDFQFVLDYMEAAKIKECIILNEPLYYYIRWNNTSLMSKFGLIQSQQEFARAEQLHRISAERNTVRRDAMIQQTKQNYLYHIFRNHNLSKQEKLAAIEAIMCDGKSRSHYRKQLPLYRKEKLSTAIQIVKQLPNRIQDRGSRALRDFRIRNIRRQVQISELSILSQNCIGGVLYHDLGHQFFSPTINLFMKGPDFVRFAANLRHYMKQELVMRWGGEYPIGMLDDVEIHFMHYETCKEASEAWQRRKARINWDRIFVLCTDRDGFDDETYALWKQIPYPKLLFTANPSYTEDSLFFPEYEKEGMVGDLITKREFYKGDVLATRLKHSNLFIK